jgi:hypothetical protein
MDRHVRILGSRPLRQAEKPANQSEDNNNFMEHRVILRGPGFGQGLALVTSVSIFVCDPLRTPNGIGCDIQMPPTANVPYCTMVWPILWDWSAWRAAFTLPSPARRHSFNGRIACSSPWIDTKV